MGSRRYDLQNNFNMEQQILEAVGVRRESPEDYLRGKDYVKADDLEMMKRISASVQKDKPGRGKDKAQTSLF